MSLRKSKSKVKRLNKFPRKSKSPVSEPCLSKTDKKTSGKTKPRVTKRRKIKLKDYWFWEREKLRNKPNWSHRLSR